MLAIVFFSSLAAAYFIEDGRIFKEAGQEIGLKGLNWFGFETDEHVAHGLWVRNWRDMIGQIKELGFNAVRLPFCPASLWGAPVSSVDYSINEDMEGLDSLACLDKFVEELNRQEIFILLDHHSADCASISDLWYTDNYSEGKWIEDLVFAAGRYSHLEYFIGIDLKNEPHGRATWGTGNAATDWNLAAARASRAILDISGGLLVFVEGIENNPSCQGHYEHWHGGNIEPEECYPLEIPSENLVLAPHVYGPDVYPQPYFDDPSFPLNMDAVWDGHLGRFAKKGYAVAIGEFGGRYGEGNPMDRGLQDAFAAYFGKNGLRHLFYWSLNPNSADTGGILMDDWVTPRRDKMDMLRVLWGGAGADNAPGTGEDNGEDGRLPEEGGAAQVPPDGESRQSAGDNGQPSAVQPGTAGCSLNPAGSGCRDHAILGLAFMLIFAPVVRRVRGLRLPFSDESVFENRA